MIKKYKTDTFLNGERCINSASGGNGEITLDYTSSCNCCLQKYFRKKLKLKTTNQSRACLEEMYMKNNTFFRSRDLTFLFFENINLVSKS